MKNFLALTQALNYIEKSLTEPIAREEIASSCFVSLSSLEKLFGYALGCSIKEYITKRRMTLAAGELAKAEQRITDIAIKYQYNSPEVFIRSFQKVWKITPSRFKERWKFTGIFPRHDFTLKEGDNLIMARKKVDLSEAYDFFRRKQGTYVICFDIRELMPINGISRKAGDLAILEAASRIDSAAAEDMLTLRIGGDEFALVTGLTDTEEVKRLSEKVLALNGQCIQFEGKEIPICLWASTTTVPQSTLRYTEFFTEMHRAIADSKV